jgi:hypothetical protein
MVSHFDSWAAPAPSTESCALAVAPNVSHTVVIATASGNGESRRGRLDQDEPHTLARSAEKTPNPHFASIGIKAADAKLSPAASGPKETERRSAVANDDVA